MVRLNVPPLTEERRTRDGEAGPQAGRGRARRDLRIHRREAADHLKKAQRDGTVTEDEERRELDALQKLTDRYIVAIDERTERKEAEVMEV